MSTLAEATDKAVLLEAVEHISGYGHEYADRYRLDDATGEYRLASGADQPPDLHWVSGDPSCSP